MLNEYRQGPMRYQTLLFFVTTAFAGACASGTPAPTAPTPGAPPAPANEPAAERPTGAAADPAETAGIPDTYREADVAFMRGMIHHHAQALVMAELAQRNSESDELRLLASRITNSQLDEIAQMQRWLADRGLLVPQPDTMVPGDAGQEMQAGHETPAHEAMHMAGMLTPEQLDRLAAARGEAFDRLFLTYMIQHHRGALTMVDDLIAGGGGLGDDTFRLASDIGAEQASEIERMQQMLHELMFGPGASR